MAKRQKLSIITSVYYNGETLPIQFKEVQKLEKKLDIFNMDLELIYIDDGSKDNSFNELMKIKAKRPATKVIKLTRNFGAVQASSLGFHYATGDCITVLAADLQDPPEQILKMIEEWKKGSKYTLSRRVKRSDPFSTIIFANMYYKMLDLLVVKGYPRGGYDLFLIDKQLLPYLRELHGRINYQLYLYWLGFKPIVLEYVRQKRKHGKSQWTFLKKLNFFIDNITGFSITLIRLISAFGIVTSLFSFCYGLWMFITALIDGTTVPGFATIVVLISFSAGTIMAMLAIIAEYIWRIFEVIQKKPTRVIEEEYLKIKH